MAETQPTHVAIIPDGNRRWAEHQGVTSLAGHQAGSEAFERIARHAITLGIQHLSIWGLSKDNFVKRSPKEVAGLLKLFKSQFDKLAQDDLIHDEQVKINVLGEWTEHFPASARRSAARAIEVTEEYRTLFLNIFLAYNGTDELLEAIQALVTEGSTKPVTAERLKEHLLTRDLPPVDLLIRTGGEPHLSAGFMMWDMADAELYFTPTLWPDFSSKDFDAALADFASRRRKKGA